MPFFKNNAPGPRTLNVQGGAPGVAVQLTLQPGEVSPDVELMGDVSKDQATQARMESGEISEVSEQDAKLGPLSGFSMEELLKLEAELAEKTQQIQLMRGQLSAAELDTYRLTPPRQFGGDGGAAQMPTVDQQGGALTPQQEEAGGRQEPPRATAAPAQVGMASQLPPDQVEPQKQAAEQAQQKAQQSAPKPPVKK